MYNGLNNTPLVRFDTGKNSREYRISPSNCGRVFRRHTEADGAFMLTGDYFSNQSAIYGADVLVAENPDKYQLLEKFSDVYVELEDRLTHGGFFGIRDDFQFFDANRRDMPGSRCGKLMILDQADYGIHHIFFDDEITNAEDCCVDVWDIAEKKRVPLDEAYGKFLYEVDPVEAILNPDYFINAFNQCVKRREEDIDNLNKAGGDARITPGYLKSCEPSEYLENTVFPLLLPAFQILEEQKPSDPLNFLAVYLMENKKRVGPPKVEPQQEQKGND